MNKKISKWLSFAALLMFAAATYQIAGGQIMQGVVFFGAAVCFTTAANRYREKDKEEKQEGRDNT